ncbi:hypothetical protein Tco_1277191, partial [Tanacetum coccineum]
ESVRESLIAISQEIAYSPVTENANGIKEATITNAKAKTIDELRTELISIAYFDPSDSTVKN